MSDRVVDTRKAIWDDVYECSFHYSTSRTVEQIKKYGTPTTGDPDIDKEMLDVMVTRYITIDDMVERLRNNLNFNVVNQSDTVKIYDAIQAHLEAWHFEIVNYHGHDYAPKEDLVLMDRLANMVHFYSKHLTKGSELSALGHFFAGTDGFGGQIGSCGTYYSPNSGVFDNLDNLDYGKGATKAKVDVELIDYMNPERISLGTSFKR